MTAFLLKPLSFSSFSLKPTPEEIAQFLKLEKEKISQKIEDRLQQFTDQLKQELVESELSLEKLKARLKQKT